MVGVRVASHWINIFLLGTSECAAVLDVLTHPHVLPETPHTKKKKNAPTELPIFPYTGVPLVITASYFINTLEADLAGLP